MPRGEGKIISKWVRVSNEFIWLAAQRKGGLTFALGFD
jgi:hypothetical protein